jgi:putative phage-type endonuclease
MKKLQMIPTAKLSEADWQSLRLTLVRQGMIGGSDSGTLLGINQYKSPINMYYQAVGVGNPPNIMNAAMLHGKQLEDYVAKCWQYYDGTDEGWVNNTITNNKIKKYRRLRAIVINPKYPVLFANVDGIITKHPIYGKKRGILEIKTISGYSADSYEAGIPPSYLIQVQHYMLVMGLDYADICYLKDGRQLGCVTFEKDEELQQRILTAAMDYNSRVITARQEIDTLGLEGNDALQAASVYEPDADHSQAFNAFISEKHKAREEEITIHGSEEHETWAIAYNSLGVEIKTLENDKQLYQNKLKQVMEKEGATVMMLPNGKITWRKQFNVKL